MLYLLVEHAARRYRISKLAPARACLTKVAVPATGAIAAEVHDLCAGLTINRTNLTRNRRAAEQGHKMQRTTALLARHARRRFATTSTLYVDGAAAAASDNATIKTRSPADGSVLAELGRVRRRAARVVAAAARCHDSGAYFRDGAARRDALERAAAALRKDADRVRDERRRATAARRLRGRGRRGLLRGHARLLRGPRGRRFHERAEAARAAAGRAYPSYAIDATA